MSRSLRSSSQLAHDKLFDGGRTASAGKDERRVEKELRRRIAELERALDKKTDKLEITDVGVSLRVTCSRELVAAGYPLAAVSRVALISRQALYRVPRARTAPQRRPSKDEVEEAIVEVAKQNPTDGYRDDLCART